mmetsp:Transcript_17404/g.40169  ORF Transcript_17404/g.40169 Transcript_17404/m.40169 type:complete len:105 (-) Transcript_17404:314-628(-)
MMYSVIVCAMCTNRKGNSIEYYLDSSIHHIHRRVVFIEGEANAGGVNPERGSLRSRNAWMKILDEYVFVNSRVLPFSEYEEGDDQTTTPSLGDFVDHGLFSALR